MLIVFGNGKCPICGDFAKELATDKKAMHCPKCEVAFDEFFISGQITEKFENKYWN